jgi:hypothetical protein
MDSSVWLRGKDDRVVPGRTATGLAVAGAVLVAGCTAPWGDQVRDRWEGRSRVPGCGDVRLGQGESLERAARAEVACLGAALDSSTGAELTVRYSTTEGDPVTDHYRITPSGTAEVYTDATEDRFSDQKWHFSECHQPRTALDVSC